MIIDDKEETQTKVANKIKASILFITGRPIAPGLGVAIYDRIKFRFHMEDLETALKAMEDEGLQKFSGNDLVKRMWTTRTMRLEAEDQKRYGHVNREVRTACPEIMNMISAIQHGNKEALKKYGLSETFLQPNAIIKLRSGKEISAHVENTTDDFKAATMGRDDQGRVLIDLSMVNYKVLDYGRLAPMEEEWIETPGIDHDEEWVQ